MAKAHGAIVIGTAGTKEGMDLVKKSGADYVFNHREDDYLKKIKNLTSKVKINLIIEMLANVNLEKDLELLGMYGRVVIVGNNGP